LQRKRDDSFDFWRPESVLKVFDDAAAKLLEEVGLEELANVRAAELSYGRKRALEVATTFALDPEMMLLDEPMAGMGREDVRRIEQVIRKVAVNRTILMVEYNLSVVASLSDRITVLARGQVLAEGSYNEVSQNPQVIEAYIGSGRGRAH
jgi:branched-chain amino acid transport system ATP-binding protein